LFDKYRAARMQTRRAIIGQASDQYALYALLRHFVDTEVVDDANLTPHIESFRAACIVVDLLKFVKTRQVTAESVRARLPTAISNFLRAHMIAYGRRRIRPKHHWLFDVAETALRHGMVLDMFVIERLHLRVKSHAELVRNTISYSRSALALVLCAQLYDLQQGVARDGLLGRTIPYPGVHGAVMADGLLCNGQKIHVDDIVFHGESPGCVLACARADDATMWLLVEIMELVTHVTPPLLVFYLVLPCLETMCLQKSLVCLFSFVNWSCRSNCAVQSLYIQTASPCV
jgi:hypothetical protein